MFLDHSSEMGGAELYLLDLARHVPNAQVLLFDEGPLAVKLRSADVPTSIAGAGHAFLDVSRHGSIFEGLRAIPSLTYLLWRVIQHTRFIDVLYANSQKSFIVAAIASFITGVPLIWNLHDILSTEHFSAAKIRIVIALANRCASLVVVNSEASRAAFVEAGGMADITRIAYNGIDPDRFNRVSSSDVKKVRENLGVDKSTPLIGVFSRLAPWKGQHVLLNALAKIPAAHGVIVGEALFQEEQVYAQYLRSEADRLNVNERVHFLGFREDIPCLMRTVDVVAHTSISAEPFGRVIVEGLLAGRPVIATNAGGAVEIIEDGSHGLLVPPGDADALALAIRQILDSPDQAEHWARSGRAHARSTFTVEAMIAQVMSAIGEAV
jgi:glycosyltransferase involved in cell wall biosynthesis